MKRKAKSSLQPNNFLPKLVKNKTKLVQFTNPLTNTPTETPRKSALEQAQTITQVSVVIKPQGNKIDLIPEITNIKDESKIQLKVKNTKNLHHEKTLPLIDENKIDNEKTSPETLEDVQNQLDSLQELQNHVFNLSDIISKVVSTNFSQIISDTNLHGETNSMYNQFRRFYTTAIKYFNGLYKIMSQNAEERKNKALPLSDVRTSSFTFCEKWKESVNIYQIIEENCLISLSEYITVKFKSINNSIVEITTTNRKDTVHAESLLETGGKLRQLIYGLNRGIRETLLHSTLRSLDQSLINVHISDVKAFIQVYNNAHFREFPKSAFNSIDLAQYKSSVIATFNDIIKALKVSCSMKDDMTIILDEVTIIQKYLNSIVKSLNLPQSIIKTVAKSKPKPEKIDDIDPLEKIKKFVGGYEVSIVVCSKIEEFIENIQMKLDLPFDDPKLNVWERLKKLQTFFVKKIDFISEREKDFAIFKKNMTDKEEELEKMVKEAQNESEKSAIKQKQLSEKVEELNEQLEKVIKEKNEVIEELGKKESYIHDLRDQKCNQKNKECLEKIGKKMGQLINKNEKDFDFNKNDEDIQDVDKMSVFVVQKRCKTCLEYKQLRKQLNDALKGIIDFQNGESIISIVNRLKDEVEDLRTTNKDLIHKNQELINKNQSLLNEIQGLKKAILNVFQKSKQFKDLNLNSLDDKTPEEIAQLIIDALNDIERQHQEELKQKEKEMLIHEAEKLEEISKKLRNKEDEGVDSPTRNNVKYLHKSTSTMFNDSEFISQNIINEIQLIKNQLKEKEREIEFKNSVLKRIQNWMIKMSEMHEKEEDSSPIDKKFDILMKAIENRPNPLKKALSKAINELNHVGSELLLFATRMDQFFDHQTPKLDSDPLTVLKYILKKFEGLFKLLEQLKSEHEIFLEENRTIEACLRSICKQAAHLNEIDNIVIDNLSLTQLAYQAQSLVDDLGNLDDKKRFIPICEVNSMTKQMRKIIGIHSIDPIKYLPILSQNLIRYYNSFIEIDKFEPLLASLFQSFDFKKESIDPNSEDFIIIREQVFEINGIMGKMAENQMTKSLVQVLKYLITMCSYLVSCLASTGLEK